VGDWTGTLISSLNAGAKLRGVDADMLRDIAAAQTSAWTDWTPTLTNLTKGDGTQIAKYRRLGSGSIDFFWKLVLGSTSSVGTSPSITLPVAASADYSTYPPFGYGMLTDASTSARAPIVVNLTSTTTVVLQYFSALNTVANLGAAAPWVWTTSDVLTLQGTYYP